MQRRAVLEREGRHAVTQASPGFPGEPSPDATTVASRPFPALSQREAEPLLGWGWSRTRSGRPRGSVLLVGTVLCPHRGQVSQETLLESSSDTLLGSPATLLCSA